MPTFICRLASSMDACPKRSLMRNARSHCVRIAPARATILAIFCDLGRDEAIAHMSGAPDRSELLHGDVLQLRRGAAWRGQNCRSQRAFRARFALKPDFLEAELALCMAQLRALRARIQIAERRDAYASRCQTERGCGNTPVPALHGPIAPTSRFISRIRVLTIESCKSIRLAGLQDHGCEIHGSCLPNLQFARKDQAGDRQRFFQAALELEDSDQGMAHAARPESFHVSGYYTTANGIARPTRGGLVRSLRPGPASLDAWRRMILDDGRCADFPRNRHDKLSAQLAAQRLAAVQCASWGHPHQRFPTIDTSSAAIHEPAEAAAHYSERLLRLPKLSIYYEPAVSACRDRPAQLGLRDSAVVYWCCQSLPKYLRNSTTSSHALQAEFPTVSLSLSNSQGQGITEMFRARLDRAFKAVGLSAANHHVFLRDFVPDRFVAAIGQCDVVLDSIGWSGCNSILESLVHNLPS